MRSRPLSSNTVLSFDAKLKKNRFIGLTLMTTELTDISGGTLIYPEAMSLSEEYTRPHAKFELPGPSGIEKSLV
jgi:hypothetical protein